MHISLCEGGAERLSATQEAFHRHSCPQQLQRVHVRVCVLERVRLRVRAHVVRVSTNQYAGTYSRTHHCSVGGLQRRWPLRAAATRAADTTRAANSKRL